MVSGSLDVIVATGVGTIVATGVGALLGWILAEWSSWRKMSFEWKLRRYERPMERLSAFYEGVAATRKGGAATDPREEFLAEYRRAWLYSPDDVIRAGNTFLRAVSTSEPVDAAERRRAALDFVTALRWDLFRWGPLRWGPLRRGPLRRTQLTGDDFEFWSPTHDQPSPAG